MRRVFSWPFFLLLIILFFAGTAEFWSNSRPLVLSWHGHYYFPILFTYSPEQFEIQNRARVDYKSLQLKADDWAFWPMNRWDAYESNRSVSEYPSPPSAENWLGTDNRGRDLLSRLLYGLRYSFALSLIIWFLSAAIATVVGTFSAFAFGWIDTLTQRSTEVLASIPQFLLLLLVITLFPPSPLLLIGAMSVFGWMGLSFLVRGEALHVRKLPFVEAEEALGASHFRVWRRLILPNSLTTVLALSPLIIVGNLMSLTALDFLGIGLPAPTPTWGEILNQAQQHFSWAWWLAVYPTLFLFVLVFCLSMIGERLKRVLLIALGGLCTCIAFQAEKVQAGSFNLESRSISSTDAMELRNTRLQYTGDTLSSTAEFGNGESSNQEFSSLRAELGYKMSLEENSSLTAKGGLQRLDMAVNPYATQIPLYSISYFATNPNIWEFSLTAGQDYFYQDWLGHGALRESISQHKLFGNFETLLTENLRIRSNATLAWLNDANSMSAADFALLREFSKGKYWWIAGPGVFATGFAQNEKPYWAPRQFAEVGLRSIATLRMSRKFSTELNLMLGEGKELNGASGLDTFAECKLLFTPNAFWLVQFAVAQFEAIRSQGDWRRRDVNVNLTAKF